MAPSLRRDLPIQDRIRDLLHWEESACDWCGSQQGDLLFEGGDGLLDLPGMFRHVRCYKCGLIRQNPRLAWESLKEYYPKDYTSYSPILKEERSRWRQWDRRYGMWKRLRLIQKRQGGGQLLDVGCGTGIFLEAALRTKRWQVVGIEPTQWAANYARQSLGANVLTGSLADVSLPENYFHLVTMWDVLEHLPQPVQDLRQVHRLLREGGWLVFSIPNVESLGARVFGPYWIGWDLPRHLYLFPRPTLETILTSLGFRIDGWQCLSMSYNTLGHSLEFWSKSWAPRHPTLARGLVRAYHTLFMRAGLLLPLGMLDRLNLSSLITVFAQKVSR